MVSSALHLIIKFMIYNRVYNQSINNEAKNEEIVRAFRANGK
jgi:hypothetical protein